MLQVAKAACIVSTTVPVLFAIILYNIGFVYWDLAHMGNWLFHCPPGIICWFLTTPALRALALSWEGLLAALAWWAIWQCLYGMVVYGFMADFFDRHREVSSPHCLPACLPV